MAKRDLSKEGVREMVELGAVFVLLGGTVGLLHEAGFGVEVAVGAAVGALLFALILTIGALLGMIGLKT
jgi:hypothetical protein